MSKRLRRANGLTISVLIILIVWMILLTITLNTGLGACADGACDGSLSPLLTWLLIGAAWFSISGLAWAAIAYNHKGNIG